MQIDYTHADLSDIDLIYEMQCAAFKPAFHESKDIFKALLKKYPAGCFMINCGDETAGYLMMHPDHKGRKNYEDKQKLDGKENALFIHDLCIHPDFQNKGIASATADFIEDYAFVNRFRYIIGVAIKDAQNFWIRKGFAMVRPHLYCGEDAMLMEKVIG